MTLLLWADGATVVAFVVLVAALGARDLMHRIRRAMKKPVPVEPPVRVTIRAPWINNEETGE